MSIPVPTTRPDFKSQQLQTAFGAADAHVTVPKKTTAGAGLQTAAQANDHLSLYWFTVADNSCFINFDAAATNANVSLPPGVYGPWQVPPGTEVHVLEDSGAGFFGLVRAILM